MLTVKQPQPYGYKSVHDLPTPPSTSRPSPPLIYQEYAHKALPVNPRSHSPPSQPMSAPHRSLPPPAAMALPPQQQPPPAGPPPSSHHAPPPPPPQHALTPSHQARDSWGQLPAPPQQWQGAEEPMKNWLQAKSEEDKRRQEEERRRQEEEKTRQEEEKTRQETLRLEQRRIEMDMLRTSLSGGIPPAMVPLVFAGMGSGGVLPQAVLEWAQQYMPPSQQQQQTYQPQLLPPQPVSPEHQRGPEMPGPYSGLPGAPAQAPHGGYAYPGSPTRPRGHTVVATMGRPPGTMSSLPSLNTNIPQPGHGAPVMAHPHMHQGLPAQQQETQASPSIYFHHWQPPTTQSSGSSNRPGTPSGETSSKKRKATEQHGPSPPRGDSRFRSPPPFGQTGHSNLSRARRGHARQRSDISSYRSFDSARSRRESFGPPFRGMSPIRSPARGSQGLGPEREGSERSERSEPPKQSISSMLSEEPQTTSQQSTPAFPAGDGGERQLRESTPAETRAHGGAGESGAGASASEGGREEL